MKFSEKYYPYPKCYWCESYARTGLHSVTCPIKHAPPVIPRASDTLREIPAKIPPQNPASNEPKIL